MGDAILATPAILLFRRNFPTAKIDFVGSSISKALFENMPIDRHFEVYRSFPQASWSYLVLLKKIRGTKYDLAFDASGSSAALGSFIVGFSAARLRVGLKGKWDRWFNVPLHRPAIRNKYRILPELLGSLGLDNPTMYPRLFLSPGEVRQGKTRMQVLVGSNKAPIVGIFVGGRKARGKRWAREKFLELAIRLLGAGAQPVIFVGPEERDLLAYFQRELRGNARTIFEPDVRAFASLVANCNLFVACDSGPIHLACALRVRTVAIFLKDEFDHWGPPADLGRIICPEEAVSVDAVFEACVRESSNDHSKADSGSLSHCPEMKQMQKCNTARLTILRIGEQPPSARVAIAETRRLGYRLIYFLRLGLILEAARRGRPWIG
ncbi:MAG: glycosyltransferase family 9 protein [Candidatus Binatia bacterium]